MSAPKAIPPKQIADNWIKDPPKEADIDNVSYESDEHKKNVAAFITGIE